MSNEAENLNVFIRVRSFSENFNLINKFNLPLGKINFTLSSSIITSFAHPFPPPPLSVYSGSPHDPTQKIRAVMEK